MVTERVFVLAVGLYLGCAASAGAAEIPPLIDAVREGDTPTVLALLAQGADVNVTEGDGASALHWASYRDDARVVGLLLDAGADVDATNDLGATPLWVASQNGNAVTASALLEAGADPNLVLLAGESPLMVAARSGSHDVVDRLLTHGAEIDASGARGQTALMWAVAQRHAVVVETLLSHGADVHARSDVWTQMMAVPPHSYTKREIPHGGNTALLFAARVGALESARVLIMGGANVNDADAWGISATTLAAHLGQADLVDYLLDAGADPNAAEAGIAPLHNAVMLNDVETVEALLDHGADPNIRLRTWSPTRRASRDRYFPASLVGATPFWLAARFARAQMMRLLVDHGANPLFVHEVDYVVDGRYERINERTTALMAALGMGGGRLRAWVPSSPVESEALTLEAIRLAVELGVDVNAVDASGRTVLDGARAVPLDAVVVFLESRGAVSGTP